MIALSTSDSCFMAMYNWFNGSSLKARFSVVIKSGKGSEVKDNACGVRFELKKNLVLNANSLAGLRFSLSHVRNRRDKILVSSPTVR